MSDFIFNKRRQRPRRDVKETSMSETTLMILLTIKDEEMWPYVISKSIESKTDLIIPTQTVYTTLRRCQSLGWTTCHDIVDEDNKQRTVYKTTDEGLDVCKWKEKQLSAIDKAIKKIKKEV